MIKFRNNMQTSPFIYREVAKNTIQPFPCCLQPSKYNIDNELNLKVLKN